MSRTHTPSQSVFITGASSGLGRGLALELGRKSYRLALTARRLDALEELAREIRNQSGNENVIVRKLDVTDSQAVWDVFHECAHALGGIDIVVVNAGIASRAAARTRTFHQAEQVFQVNVLGAVATIEAAMSYFTERGHGHIVGISSVAGLRGLPRSAPYSASKAALAVYLESLQAELGRSDIDVTILYPGFIDTAMNRDLPRRPFVISLERGSRILARKIERRVRSSTVPTIPWGILSRVFKLLPTRFLSGLR